MISLSPLVLALVLRAPAFATNPCDAGDASKCADTKTVAQASGGCGQDGRCSESFAVHRSLADQLGEQSYKELAARYEQIVKGYKSEEGKKVKGTGGAEALGLPRLSPDAADWVQRKHDFEGLNGGSCKIPQHLDGWGVINAQLQCDMGILAQGRNQSVDWLKEIEAARNKKLFQDLVTRKVDHMLPPPMADKKISVSDLIYIYLGHDARKYISDKWQFFDDACKGDKIGDAGLQAKAQSFIGAAGSKAEICKGSLDIDAKKDQFHQQAKQVSKTLGKNPSALFDKSKGQFGSLDLSDTVGGVKVAAASVGAARVAPPVKPPVDDKDKEGWRASLARTEKMLDDKLSAIADLQGKLAGLDQKDPKVQQALKDLAEAQKSLQDVRAKIEAGIHSDDPQAAANATLGASGSALSQANGAINEAEPLVAAKPPPPPTKEISQAAKDSLTALQGYKTFSGKKGGLYDPSTDTLQKAYFAFKGQTLPGDGPAVSDKVSQELLRRVTANCGRSGLPWKHLGGADPSIGGDYLAEVGKTACVPKPGEGGAGGGKGNGGGGPSKLKADLFAAPLDQVHVESFGGTGQAIAEQKVGGAHGRVVQVTWTPDNDQGGLGIGFARVMSPDGRSGEFKVDGEFYVVEPGTTFEYKRPGDAAAHVYVAKDGLKIAKSGGLVGNFDDKGAAAPEAVEAVWSWGDEWKDPEAKRIIKVDVYGGEGHDKEMLELVKPNSQGRGIEVGENAYVIPAGTQVRVKDKAGEGCFEATSDVKLVRDIRKDALKGPENWSTDLGHRTDEYEKAQGGLGVATTKKCG